MMLHVLQGDADAPLAPLHGRTVAILGYGNQGRAHALNLRDSGVGVIVGSEEARRGFAIAHADGFEAISLGEAARAADLVIIALPDEAQPQAWREIEHALRRGATVGFIHGFAIHHKLIAPRADLGIVMVAPKGPGQTLRARYVEDYGLPCLLAIERESAQGDAHALALAWANGIGAARAGIIETTFAHETETDLFGEQAVLVGGVTALTRAAFETLVEAGYPRELAYIECVHELKQVVDLLFERGAAGMMQAVSNTAEFGGYEFADALDDEALRARLRALLADIQSGAFAHRFMRDATANDHAWIEAQRRELREGEMEKIGESVRELWNEREKKRRRDEET